MTKFTSIIFCLIIVLLTSCEHEAQLTYKIKNNANFTIKVISTNTDPKTKTDTFKISNNEQTTIAVNGQGLNRVSYYKEKEEKLRDFTQMDIFKNDTLKSATDFLKSSRWEYDETGKHSANYILTVSNSDF